jgi:hypothetical protein
LPRRSSRTRRFDEDNRSIQICCIVSPILYFNLDIHRHPHSLILELLAEFGLVGLVLFAALVLVLVSLRRLREDPALMLAVMLCINAFINAMTSGDLPDNRNLFAMLGVLAMRPPGGPTDACIEGPAPQLGEPNLGRADFPQTAHPGQAQVLGRARSAARGR